MKLYLIHLQVDGRWMTAGHVKAKSADAAIRSVMKDERDAGVTGIYVTEVV
jgi:hypothetical protein